MDILWHPLPWPVAFGGAAVIGALVALFQIVHLLKEIGGDMRAIRTQIGEMSGNITGIANAVADIRGNQKSEYTPSEYVPFRDD